MGEDLPQSRQRGGTERVALEPEVRDDGGGGPCGGEEAQAVGVEAVAGHVPRFHAERVGAHEGRDAGGAHVAHQVVAHDEVPDLLVGVEAGHQGLGVGGPDGELAHVQAAVFVDGADLEGVHLRAVVGLFGGGGAEVEGEPSGPVGSGRPVMASWVNMGARLSVDARSTGTGRAGASVRGRGSFTSSYGPCLRIRWAHLSFLGSLLRGMRSSCPFWEIDISSPSGGGGSVSAIWSKLRNRGRLFVN